jgi:hypothetical protein
MSKQKPAKCERCETLKSTHPTPSQWRRVEQNNYRTQTVTHKRDGQIQIAGQSGIKVWLCPSCFQSWERDIIARHNESLRREQTW